MPSGTYRAKGTLFSRDSQINRRRPAQGLRAPRRENDIVIPRILHDLKKTTTFVLTKRSQLETKLSVLLIKGDHDYRPKRIYRTVIGETLERQGKDCDRYKTFGKVISAFNPFQEPVNRGWRPKRKIPSHNTVKNYLDYVEDAFLFQSAKRWDVKGRKYFDTIQKYYAMDLGLRNARLNFRQQERSHLMENMIYNDLIRRGYAVDVGIVELTRVIDGKRRMSQYEIDFVVNVGNDKVYIQSALNVDTPEKKAQETFSLRNTGDFFRKIVVLDGNSKLWADDDGVMYVGVIPFLLDDMVAEVIR